MRGRFLTGLLKPPVHPLGNLAVGGVDYRRMYVFLFIGVIASTVGLESWMALINNFAVEEAGLSGFQYGSLQSVREIPGFLALLVIYLLLLFKEHRLAAVSILMLGLGVLLTGFLPSFGGLLAVTLLMSFGFHYFETVNQSLTLQYFDLQMAPLVFGRLHAMASATSVLVSLCLFLLASLLEFRELFLLMGAMVALAGVWMLFQDPSDKKLAPQRRRMVFKKRYWLFYTLTLLGGARRQIFVAFAVFLLVKKFGLSLQAVTLLFLVNHGINYFLAPLLGRAINRFGERRVLTMEYATLLLVFSAYAMVDNPWVAAGLYVLDHIVYTFAVAIETYFQKIAEPGDIAPSMAVGFTINHVAAVLMPVTGGLMWMVDHRIPFLGGVVLALASLVLVQWIPRHESVEKAAGSR